MLLLGDPKNDTFLNFEAPKTAVAGNFLSSYLACRSSELTPQMINRVRVTILHSDSESCLDLVDRIYAIFE